ncbi:MAG: PAS domain S-box protein [Betaproteobacteria bacterium]
MNTTASNGAITVLEASLSQALTQDVLLENDSVFRQLLESSNDAVVTMSEDGCLASWNPGATLMFGWTAAEAVGKRLSELMIPPAMRERHEAGRQRILAGGEPKIMNRQVELSALRKDGREIPVELSVWPIKLEKHTLFGAFIRDISERHFAEAALRDSEQRLRHVIDNVSEGIIVVQDGRIVFANPRTENLVGRSLEQLRAQPFTDSIHPDDRPVVADHYARRLRGEYVEPKYAFRINSQTSGTRWVELSAVMIEWEGRSATLSFITDITERKRLQDSLTQSLSERETILQNSIVGIAFLNPQGRVHWANRVIMQMFRGKEINYIGHSLEQYYLSREEYIRVGSAVMAAVGKGQFFETEMQMRRADDTRFWAYLSGRAVNMADLSQGTVWVVMDITARKQLEESLRLSKIQYQTVVDNVTEGMTVVQDGKFIFANPAFLNLLGYTSEEIIGSDFTPVVYQDDLALIMRNRERRLHGEVFESKYDFRVVHKDGTPIWVQVSAVLVDWHGSPATLSFIADITRRKQAEEDIRVSLEKQRELNQLKSRFVAMTSHEFRTPLATILSSAELLKYYSDKMPAEERVELIDSIEAAVRRMTKMLDDVLLIGKVEAEKLEFNPKPVMLDVFCRAIRDEALSAAAALPGSIAELELNMTDCNAEVVIDEKLMRHILGNLLSNAVKYSPNGGRVHFDITCRSNEMIFSVADSGIGLSKEDLPRLFETFYRASNVGNISGTGLGLAIVKHSVAKHGGEISVASELDAGTRFVVTIPRVDAAAG